ncbi:MAG: acyl-CoA dehydratase activase-related protein, partial [candidate division WOR-3 bacterium]|nr:acyl-CoA dehydratase activase-related protein [candidate division WOR-3 bacterium]
LYNLLYLCQDSYNNKLQILTFSVNRHTLNKIIMKIGLPRALFYFRYGKFWEQFFLNLNINVVVSPQTNQQILDIGVKKVTSEICLPIKIICGHIEWLKGQVDAIFLPRITQLNHGLYTCPKMIGIVDIARMQVGNLCTIMAPQIRNHFLSSHFWFGISLVNNPWSVHKAITKALPFLAHRPSIISNHRPKILILSHFYNLSDEFISQDIIRTFKNQGFMIVTKEDLPIKILNRNNGFSKNIRWVYERELYNAFQYSLDKVAGICNIISFGCGPDSLISEIMQIQAQNHNIPFLQIVLDEHTSKTGLITRLEAFSEIIRRNQECQN